MIIRMVIIIMEARAIKMTVLYRIMITMEMIVKITMIINNRLKILL